MALQQNVQKVLAGLAGGFLVATLGLFAAQPASALTPALASAQLTDEENGFLRSALFGVYFEEKYADMADKKATDPRVKAAAEAGLADQAAVKTKIQALAASSGLQLPTELPPYLSQNLQAIQSQTGLAFDRAWAEGSATGAQRGLLDAANAVVSTNNEVKTITAAYRTSLEKHYARTLKLARALGTRVPALVNTGEGPAQPATPGTPLTPGTPIFLMALGLLGLSAAAVAGRVLTRPQGHLS